MNEPITVETTVKANVKECWKIWTNVEDILKFNNPFADWHTAKVESDLKEGGLFFYRMEAKDGTTGFDFAGKYDEIVEHSLIAYTGNDGRKAINKFTANGNETIVTEIFEPDATTPLALQKEFCQTILDNFKKYVEGKNSN